MKKSLMLCACVCLILCLTGCGGERSSGENAEGKPANEASFTAGNSESASDAGKSSVTEAKTDSFVSSEDKEAQEESKAEPAQDKNGKAENKMPTQENSKAQAENQEPAQIQNKVQAVPPSESLDMTAGGDTQGAAQAETNPTGTAPTAVIPAETAQAEAEPAQEQTETFDVTPYVEYAKSYAESIGLLFDSTATSCWDNPIDANATLTNIKENIRSRLDRYKNIEGFTGVWIWTEKVSEAEYEIYIGYY